MRQKEGCGFPTIGIVGVASLSHGSWEGYETCGWQKPSSRPSSCELSQEDWKALPKTLTLRYIKMGYESRSGEKKVLVVVADLLDPIRHPDKELIDLYAKRWEIEVRLRDVKTNFTT
ncbi:hypothetical protein AAFN60_02975 [Roseibacillus persicicus]|uniref:hypothetical protein n=1 Tax=Roseibacillus persicicus TaxID=454148 RepID=UPI00398B71E6